MVPSFCYSCMKGYFEIIKYMMNNERIYLNKSTNHGFTPFTVACIADDLEIIKYMINEPRIDLNKIDIFTTTSFEILCTKKNLEIIKYFLLSKRYIRYNYANINTSLEIINLIRINDVY